MDETISAEPISDPRSQRGLVLAQEQKDAIKTLVGTKYLVPSATGNGSRYVVDLRAGAEMCSCLDWAECGGYDRPHRCKHIWAAVYVLKLADGNELIVPKKEWKDAERFKKTFLRDWRATNACRTKFPRLRSVLFAELIDGSGLPEPARGKRGRPAISMRDILLISGIRTLHQMTAGEAVVAIEDLCAQGIVTVSRVPHYNTLLEKFALPENMPWLHRLLAASALPLLPFETGFTVDGTGFGSSVTDHYFTEKHGKKSQKRKPSRKHRWVEAKLVFGVRTHVIAAAQITEQHVAESPLMPELLRRVIANGGRVGEWYGDAAYLSDECIAAVEKVGGAPYFGWKRGVTGKSPGKPALRRLYEEFRDHHERYITQYRKGRPLAETGNMMLKTRFGHALQSSVIAQNRPLKIT
jgi:hypothetical protein